MSERRVEAILSETAELERTYEWLEAADLYGQALSVVDEKDFIKKGEIQEKIGYCFFHAAFQSEAHEEFLRRIRSAFEAYEKAAGFFERLVDPKSQALMNCCKAVVSYYKCWLDDYDSTKRKALLDECLVLEKEALEACEETGNTPRYVMMCNDLLRCILDRLSFTLNWQEQKNLLEEAIEFGEKVVEAHSSVITEHELARTYTFLSIHYSYASNLYQSIDKQKEFSQRGLSYANKAMDISEKINDLYILGVSNGAFGHFVIEVKGDYESALRAREKQLELGKKTGDNRLISIAYEELAYLRWWKAVSMEDDPDKRRDDFNKAIQYAEEAIIRHNLISTQVTSAYMPHIECYSFLANDETNLEKKRILQRKAVEVGRDDLKQAKHSGSPLGTAFVCHSLSKALYYLSILESKTEIKRNLLDEASKNREETIYLFQQMQPFRYWNIGALYNYSALIKAELAKIEIENPEKQDFLMGAVVDMETCLKSCNLGIEAFPQTRFYNLLGQYKDWFGYILNDLYLLTGERKHLERAIGEYKDAVLAWGKGDLHSRIAETHWQMARLYDQLKEHSKSAEEFQSASERFRYAAEKIPHLAEFYTEYAVYMQAWGEFEKARYYHTERQYRRAKEHYEKAAELHKSTKQWNYLNLNYYAWAKLVEAEDLSRKEQTEEAKDNFELAASLFIEASNSIRANMEELEADEEREAAEMLFEASGVRQDYCLGRVALEEARILDRQGDHLASSRRYESAAETFQRIAETSEETQIELQPLISLSQAWQKMTQAEAEASPDLYLKASQLFEEAKDHSLDERSRRLTLGHSHFCKALEAGTRFEDLKDLTYYSEAVRHLESAASHYLRAGFENAAEYARGTQKLFDAYIYMDNASKETMPQKKARYYMMAEKVLETSVGSYLIAKHLEKSTEVQRLLRRVREERELAASLSEVLHAPIMVSTTEAFTAPMPTKEEAVGLERFENADIQANLILGVKEVKVGDDIDIEIELVNTGKAPAQLIKVEDIIPEGFEVRSTPEICRLEDSYLNMKGRTLNPLWTEELKLVLKPLNKGTFDFKPKILYLDKGGKYRYHEPEPATVTVRELGIMGWLRGPPHIK